MFRNEDLLENILLYSYDTSDGYNSSPQRMQPSCCQTCSETCNSCVREESQIETVMHRLSKLYPARNSEIWLSSRTPLATHTGVCTTEMDTSFTLLLQVSTISFTNYIKNNSTIIL